MAESYGDKTEAPSLKRRQKAREDGDVLRSRDFANALVVLAGCGWVAMLGPSLLAACKGLIAASLQFGRGDIEDFSPVRPLAQAGWQLAPSLAGLFAVALVAGVVSQAGLGALQFNPKLIAPKPSRLNPAKGLGRIFGPTGWIELAKSLLKVVLLGTIGAYMLWRISRPSLALVQSDVAGAVGSVGGLFTGVLFAMAGGLALIAGVDVPIQAIRRLGKLRMTKQEVKDEHKETEGSPEAKHAQRTRQREIAKRSVRKAVTEAHVVLTNPTHFAIALRYDRTKDAAPVVVARGRGATALAIRDVAGEVAVPILEYPALARAVYFTSREGQQVRDDLYLAVATVLAFVFSLDERVRRRQPSVVVPPNVRFDENGVRQ